MLVKDTLWNASEPAHTNSIVNIDSRCIPESQSGGASRVPDPKGNLKTRPYS